MDRLRPMLAVQETPSFDDPKFLKHFPVMASYKLDGIRAMVVDGKVVSRTLKPIRSAFVQEWFRELEGMDGELIWGEPSSPTVFRDTTSAVMTIGSREPVRYFVFDLWNVDKDYCDRLGMLCDRVAALLKQRPEMQDLVRVVSQISVSDVGKLAELEAESLARGYEGLIVRNPNRRYKFNRATLVGGELIKIKRTEDSEAEILDFEELMHNANEAKVDERGYTKRSIHQENLVPMDTLGKIRVRDIHHGWVFYIGVFKGFDKSQLKHIWNHRSQYKGKIVKYTYMSVGMKDVPRTPRVVGFRSEDDI